VARGAELVRTLAGDFAGADLEQDLALGRELRDLLADCAARATAIGRQGIGDPDVAALIYKDAVRECEEVGAHVSYQLAARVVVRGRIRVRAAAAVRAAAVDGPDIAVALRGVDARGGAPCAAVRKRHNTLRRVGIRQGVDGRHVRVAVVV